MSRYPHHFSLLYRIPSECRCLVLAVAFGFACGRLPGDTLKWNSGVSSGNLDSAGSWDPSAVPTFSDVLVFDNVGPLSASLSNDLSIDNLQIGGSDVSFSLGDKTLTVANAASINGTGSFSLLSGSLIGQRQWSEIGGNKPLNMTVSGANTLLVLAGGSLGSAGSGHSITVSNGATIRGTSHLAAMGWSNQSQLVFDNANIEMGTVQWNNRLYVCSGSTGSKVVFRNGSKIRVPIDYLALGFDAKAKHNDLVITGTGTEASLYSAYVGFNGASNTLYVLDGAVFAVTNKSMNTTMGNGATAYGNRVVVSNAQFIVQNPARWAGMTMKRESRFEVRGDRAVFRAGQLQMESGSVFKAYDNATVHIDQAWTVGYGQSEDCHLVLSNALVEANGSTLTVGSGDNQANVSHSSIDICGGTHVKLPDYSRISVGTAATDEYNSLSVVGEGTVLSNGNMTLWVGNLSRYATLLARDGGKVYASSFEVGDRGTQETATAIGSAIEVVGGGVVEGAKNTTIKMHHDTRLKVENGLVRVTVGSGTLLLEKTAALQLAGTNTLVQVWKLEMNGGSSIEFHPPENAAGVATPYIEAGNSIVTDGTCILRVVDAEECMKKGGGTYTVMRCANGVGNLDFASVELPAGASLIRETDAIKVKLPSRLGTVLLVQ